MNAHKVKNAPNLPILNFNSKKDGNIKEFDVPKIGQKESFVPGDRYV